MFCPPPFLWWANMQDVPSDEAILVPNAGDSDMTALTQRSPDPAEPRHRKKSQISSASDYRASPSPEHSAHDVRNIHEPHASKRAFTHYADCRMYQLDVERSMPVVRFFVQRCLSTTVANHDD